MKPILAICLILGAAGSAAAQTNGPRFSLAAAGGVTNLFHADFDFNPISWQVSGRVRANEHLAIEGLFHEWRHEDVRQFQDPLRQFQNTTNHRMRTIAFNVLGTATIGRVTLAGGGGAGVFGYSRRFRQETLDHTFNSSSATGQAVGEIGVAITRRVQAFGRYDLSIPFEDPGFGHGSVSGGVRVGLW